MAKKMLVVIVSLGLALSACGKCKPEALTQVPAVPSSILEWPCKHPLITGGAVIGFALVAAGLYWAYNRRYEASQRVHNFVQGLIQGAPAPFNGYNENYGHAAPVPRMSDEEMGAWVAIGGDTEIKEIAVFQEEYDCIYRLFPWDTFFPWPVWKRVAIPFAPCEDIFFGECVYVDWDDNGSRHPTFRPPRDFIVNDPYVCDNPSNEPMRTVETYYNWFGYIRKYRRIMPETMAEQAEIKFSPWKDALSLIFEIQQAAIAGFYRVPLAANVPYTPVIDEPNEAKLRKAALRQYQLPEQHPMMSF